MNKFLLTLACIACVLTITSCSGDIYSTKYQGDETIEAVLVSQLSDQEKEQFQLALDNLGYHTLQGKTVRDIIAYGKLEVKKQEKAQKELSTFIKDASEELKTGIIVDGLYKVELGNKIADAWKENMDNEELTALYEYYSTLYYLASADKDNALATLRKISPYYNGVLSEEIRKMGIDLFDSIEKWEEEHEIGIKVLEREKARLNGNLTIEVEVYKWVLEKFKNYDSITGQYSGDEFLNTIYKEAAEKFKITTQEVISIMDDIQVITEAGLLNSSPLNSSPDYNDEKQNDIPSNAISLFYDGGDILCATTKDNYSDLIDCIIVKDEVGFSQMFANGTAFRVSSMTKALVLEKHFSTNKVRICEGIYKDQIAWVAIEAIYNHK